MGHSPLYLDTDMLSHVDQFIRNIGFYGRDHPKLTIARHGLYSIDCYGYHKADVYVTKYGLSTAAACLSLNNVSKLYSNEQARADFLVR